MENFSDEEARLVSLTENLQRWNLSFKEEVNFLAELNEKRSQEGFGGDTDLSRLIHKSRTYVAKRLKLAFFPELVERVARSEISINQAYSDAVELDQLPYTKIDGEKVHNVFLGNSLTSEQVLRISEEDEPEQLELINVLPTPVTPRIRNAFKFRMVPFSRAKEALKLVEQDIDNFKDEERSELKQTLEELEKSLAQIKAKL